MRKHIFIYDSYAEIFPLILFNYNSLLTDPVAFLLKGQNLHYYLSRSFTKPIKSTKLIKRSNNNVILLQGLQNPPKGKNRVQKQIDVYDTAMAVRRRAFSINLPGPSKYQYEKY